MSDGDKKKPLTEEDIVDAAMRRSQRRLWWKVAIFVLALGLLLLFIRFC